MIMFRKVHLSLGGFCLFAVVLSTLFALTPDARADLQWTSTGPGGGGAFETTAVSALGRQEGANEGSVLVASDLGGVYRSIDLGKTWQAIGYPQGLRHTHVDVVAFHPALNSVAFLGAADGVYRSLDCGTKTTDPCTFSRKVAGVISALAVDPMAEGESTTLYAAGLERYCQAGQKVWRSQDMGATWEERSAKGLPANANIMAIRVQPGDPKTLIAISEFGRFAGESKCPQSSPPWGADAPNRAFISFDGGGNFAPLEITTRQPSLLQSDAVSSDSWAYIADARFDLADSRKIWVTVTANPAFGGKVWNVDGELWLSTGEAGIGPGIRAAAAFGSGALLPKPGHA
jgi:hypothetical protein